MGVNFMEILGRSLVVIMANKLALPNNIIVTMELVMEDNKLMVNLP